MLAPGGLLWLLRHELRISWRGWMSGVKAGGAWRIVFYLFLLVSLLAGGLGAAFLLAHVDPEPTPSVLGIIGAAFALTASLMLSQALVLTTDSLYQRGDLDLLLSSPLPAWRVLIVRMGAIAVNVGAFYLAMVFAICIFLPFTGGWRWLGTAPAVLGLALISTAIGLVLARGLFALIGPRSTRMAAQVLGALIGAAFFLALQSQNFVPYDQRAQMYARGMAMLVAWFGQHDSLVSLPARAALGNWLA